MGGYREDLIGRSILKSIFENQTDESTRSLLNKIKSAFTFLQLLLTRFRHDLFSKLRRDIWRLDEAEYRESFKRDREGGTKAKLIPVGDLGYSGSTFFTTPNSKFLIKSLPRRFEHDFFRSDLLPHYYHHMSEHPDSLLVRITDLLHAPPPQLGVLFGAAPSHHIVMENAMYGRESEPDDKAKKSWESYDLKPMSYFYPERDIMDGKLAPDSVKDKLADSFEDKIRVTNAQAKELKVQLEIDTQQLADSNAVDYSLFLVRFPASSKPENTSARQSPWREGVTDRNGEWKYRAVLLDFFWAKHKTRAKAMTGLVGSFQWLRGQKDEPMSITTKPGEYRERFLKMVDEMIEAQD
ncbi:MAG: hypothetical protein M1820_002091 [Bogoriella megaspora]|nr:MAG: hypothetical protein M1820_002091 [Bogoriella megaspora]